MGLGALINESAPISSTSGWRRIRHSHLFNNTYQLGAHKGIRGQAYRGLLLSGPRTKQTARRKAETRMNECFPQICNGHVGHHEPSNGADYELPTGSTDGELVEVVVQGPGFVSLSSMLLV